MPKPLLTYDATNMLAEAVGVSGAATDELAALHSALTKAKNTVILQAKRGEQGWLDLPIDVSMVGGIEKLAIAKGKYKTCLVLGIGGSDLGTRALYKALKTENKGMSLAFAGANTDPDELHEVLKNVDLKRTLVNVVSKSGDTLETLAAFLIVREALKKVAGKEAAQQIVATTGDNGALRELAAKERFATLSVPANVGGRFSVLTTVGLFPLACAGIPIRDILKGAGQIREKFLNEAGVRDEIRLFAGLQFLAHTKRKQKIQVLMPYAEALREFAFWYRQLWAESLGKKGKGPTPVASLGATDQHSQIQLYHDGPNDKTVTFIAVERFKHTLRLPRLTEEPESLHHLSGLSLERIIKAEREGTATALREAWRPNGTIFIPEISPNTMGALVMFFEIAAAVSGFLYGVNPYDQPGVEAGKKLIYGTMNS